jgi:hypothetical protein
MGTQRGVVAHGVVSREKSTPAAARALARAVREAFGADDPAVVLVYATVDHDPEVLLLTLAAALGPVPLVGCSTPGLMARDTFVEGSFAAGALALGGPAVRAATGACEAYAHDTAAKGHDLGRRLRDALGAPPRLVVLHGDPLCGADLEAFARAVQAETACPVVGGGSGQPWGAMVQTYQYHGVAAHSHAAVAVALAGEFTVEIATTTGTEPTPVTAAVTRVDANVLLELDGRPALAVYREFLGLPELAELRSEHNTAVALGFEFADPADDVEARAPWVVRGPFALDLARGGLVMAASVPEGTRVVFHRRSVAVALAGAESAARALARRLAGRQVRAVIGFECAARTAPLLGKAEATREQQLVQSLVAPDAAWFGMFAWGELAPFGERVTYYNFTYPLVALAE